MKHDIVGGFVFQLQGLIHARGVRPPKLGGIADPDLVEAVLGVELPVLTAFKNSE